MKHNCFTAKGIKLLQEFTIGHPVILSIDVRNNPGFDESKP